MLIGFIGKTKKVIGGLGWFNSQLTEILSNPTLDQIGLAVALGYLDLRFAGEWKAAFTDLVLWQNNFDQKVPRYQLTDPQSRS